MTINIPSISQTTLNGYLSVGISACVALLAVPSIPQKYTAIIGSALALLRILSGHLQTDAGTTPAIVPGSATPQLVPSHEVPNNPTEVAVMDHATFPKQ